MSLILEIVENIFMELVNYHLFQGLNASLALAVAWPVVKAVFKWAADEIGAGSGLARLAPFLWGFPILCLATFITLGIITGFGYMEIDPLAVSLAPFVGIEIAAGLFAVFAREEGYLEIGDKSRLVIRILGGLTFIATIVPLLALTIIPLAFGLVDATDTPSSLVALLIFQMLVSMRLFIVDPGN